MAVGLIGRKCGMTRIFEENGSMIPVSVIEIFPNFVTQIKNSDTDGYLAVQVTTGKKRVSKVTKPLRGHFAKAGVEAGTGLWEFRVEDCPDVLNDLKVGDKFTVSMFAAGQKVDVIGTTKGKGFAGVIKRYHFSMQDATHGNSLSHRAPGSIGQRQTPGRVMKGKKMAGHMGDVRRTTENLDVVKIDEERNFLLVKGSIPGAPNGEVIVIPAKKVKSKKGV